MAGAAIIPPPDRTGAQDRPGILFQPVPEVKTVKNRVHWDLREPGADDDRRAAEVERLVALGATRIGSGRQGPFGWAILADPEGNECCV